MKNIKEHEFCCILEKITGINKDRFHNLDRDSEGTWSYLLCVIGKLKGAKEGENPNITTGIGIKVKKHANQYYLRLTVGNPFDVMDIYCIDYEVVDYDLIKNIYIPEILRLLEDHHLFIQPKIMNYFN